MTTGFDIAVIGGGVIGLSLGRALAREGVHVAVIDAGNIDGSDAIPPATTAAAGMLAPSFEVDHGPTDKIGEALYAFSAASLLHWSDFAAALEEESAIEVDFRKDGILGVALDETRAEALRRDVEFLNARKAGVELVDGNEARRLEPGLSNNVIAALHAPQDAQVDPRLVLNALRISFQRASGVMIAERVVQCVSAERGFFVALANGEHVEASRIVIASGAASTALVDGIKPPPIRPVKGEALALAMPSPLLRRVVRAPGAYMCPKSDGRLVIGATEYEGRNDLTVDAAAAAGLQDNGARAAAGVAQLTPAESWAGLRPCTPDAAPILGVDPHGPEHLYFTLGHYRNGILLAPASADAMCDLILNKKNIWDVTPFRPDRFSNRV